MYINNTGAIALSQGNSTNILTKTIKKTTLSDDFIH